MDINLTSQTTGKPVFAITRDDANTFDFVLVLPLTPHFVNGTTPTFNGTADLHVGDKEAFNAVVEQPVGAVVASIETANFVAGKSYDVSYEVHDNVSSFSSTASYAFTYFNDKANYTGDAKANVVFGSSTADKLNGGKGSDFLQAAEGNDIVIGGAGNDWIAGGTGHDKLTGSGGNDAFVFDESPAKSIDVITDFVTGHDMIWLDHTVFTALKAGPVDEDQFVKNLSGKAVTADNHLIFEKDTGKIYYDSDGLGGAAGVVIAQLGDHQKIGSEDFLVI
jgi:Ca2+-binding RTX toxin-like protein